MKLIISQTIQDLIIRSKMNAVLRSRSHYDNVNLITQFKMHIWGTIESGNLLDKLRRLPTAHRLIPFVLAAYGNTSVYCWTDSSGNVHDIRQAEGGEQGDALMPALFCLGMHDALRRANAELHGDEYIVAYLDDIYIVASKERTRAIYDLVTQEIANHTGVQPNLGKTESWSPSAGPAPEGINALNAPAPAAPVWKGNLAEEDRGLEVLGSPIGTYAYVQKTLAARLEEERKLLDHIPRLHDTQSAWLLLYFCAAPRANYIIRSTPPRQSMHYARAHDNLVLECLAQMLHLPLDLLGLAHVRQQIQMPMRLGGLGLQSAEQMSQAAYWASWADVLPSLHARVPRFWPIFMRNMVALGVSIEPEAGMSAFRDLHESAVALQLQGYANIPSWNDLARGRRPSPEDPFDAINGALTGRGWQKEAAKCKINHSWEIYFATLFPSAKARIRSAAGANASHWLTAIPFEQATQLDAPIFRCALMRRLGLPVAATADFCEGCNAVLDDMGFHRTTCMRTGRVQTRHTFLIKAWRRVFREAGINIPQRNCERTLNTTHINRGSGDLRRMDLIFPGVDGVSGGMPVFADITCVSPLHGNGTPMPDAADNDGAAVCRAERRNREDDYPDVEASPHAALLCLGVETYGRWSNHCLTLVRQLAKAKARNITQDMRRPLELAFHRRWWSLLSVAVQRAVAEAILRPSGADLLSAAGSGAQLPICDLLDFHR